MIQNTKGFEEFIVNNEVSEQEEKNIEKIIKAFSEYISAVNPDYAYNKTYLSAYVQEFILCQRTLKRKYGILCDKIITKILLANAGDDSVVVIDETWTYVKGKIHLSNSINSHFVKSNKMRVEIECIHENGFVVAEEINLEEDYDEKLEACISGFIDQRKELLTDES